MECYGLSISSVSPFALRACQGQADSCSGGIHCSLCQYRAVRIIQTKHKLIVQSMQSPAPQQGLEPRTKEKHSQRGERSLGLWSCSLPCPQPTRPVTNVYLVS